MVLMTKPATLWTKTSKQKLLGGRNGDDMQSLLLELYTYTRYPKISEGTRIWVNYNTENDWGVQSPPQHGILVTLPFSEGDWIPRGIYTPEN